MADNGGPSRPRARIRAFSGGPLGIGWAPWAIGASALALGIFFFMRRGGGTAQQASGQAGPGGALPISQPYPYPTAVGPGGPQSNPSAQQLQQITPDTRWTSADWVPFQSSFWYKPGGQDAPFTKGGLTYFHLVDPNALTAYKQGGGQPYWFPQPGFPVPGETGAVYGVAPASNISSQQMASMSGNNVNLAA